MNQNQGKPFVLLGVNYDADAAVVRPLQQNGTVTWRSWWDGDPNNFGRIIEDWHVESFPMLFLIDRQGIIRKIYRGAPSPGELEAAIAKLLSAAEVAGSGS